MNGGDGGGNGGSGDGGGGSGGVGGSGGSGGSGGGELSTYATIARPISTPVRKDPFSARRAEVIIVASCATGLNGGFWISACLTTRVLPFAVCTCIMRVGDPPGILTDVAALPQRTSWGISGTASTPCSGLLPMASLISWLTPFEYGTHCPPGSSRSNDAMACPGSSSSYPCSMTHD